MQRRNHCEVLPSVRHHYESSSPLRAGWVLRQDRCGCKDTHKKKPKELSRQKKADSFQITAKLQRRRVSGERKEGVLCFNVSLIIIVRGMNCWTGKDLSHISHPQRTMLKRQNTHSIYFVQRRKTKQKTKQKEHKIFIDGPGMILDAVFQLGNKSCLPFSSLLDRLEW